MARHKRNEPPKPSARITVEIKGERYGMDLKDIDFSDSRRKLALGIGGEIIDLIYNRYEGKGKNS